MRDRPWPLVARLGRSPLAAAVHSRLAPLDRWMYQRSGGRVFLSKMLPATLLLTTTGRRTGQPRTTPLLFLRDGADLVVVASNYGKPVHPAWSQNLLADPGARVQLGRESFDVRAAAVAPADRPELWARLVRVWPAFDTYAERTTREIRVFVLRRA